MWTIVVFYSEIGCYRIIVAYIWRRIKTIIDFTPLKWVCKTAIMLRPPPSFVWRRSEMKLNQGTIWAKYLSNAGCHNWLRTVVSPLWPKNEFLGQSKALKSMCKVEVPQQLEAENGVGPFWHSCDEHRKFTSWEYVAFYADMKAGMVEFG